MIKWSKKLIILWLKTITKSIGHSPSAREIPPFLYQACLRYFGGFNKAKVVAGLRINNPKYNKLRKAAYKITSDFAYVLGAVYGDGTCSIRRSGHGTTASILLRVVDKDFALNFKMALSKWTGLSPKYEINNCNMYQVNLCSVDACRIIKQIKYQSILLWEPKFQYAFLRGFFDADG